MSLGTALIFGGSSGIGQAVAIEVIKSGSRVVIASSTQSKIDKVVAELNELAGETRAFGIVTDLSDRNTLEENVLAALKYATSDKVTADGKINHIVHTAGDRTIRYLSAVTIGKHGPSYLENSAKSSITFTAGTMVHKPVVGLSSNIGLGGAIEATVTGLAVDLAPIRVNLVLPGAIDTPLLASFLKENNIPLEYFTKDNLLQKYGSTEDGAQPYLYFMRDTFQTGNSLRSDGGRLLK